MLWGPRGARNVIPLSKALPGRYRIVGAIGRGCLNRLLELGIMPNDIIEVVKPAPGPVVIAKGTIRVGIGHGAASRIVVEPLEGRYTP